MKKINIGISTISYNEDGTVKTVAFRPTMELKLPQDYVSELNKANTQPQTDADKVKKISDDVFSSWFSQMNEIELADREQYEVKSEVVACLKYSTGVVKICSVQYSFQEIAKIGESPLN